MVFDFPLATHHKQYIVLDETYVLLDITPNVYYLLPDKTNVHLLLVATH